MYSNTKNSGGEVCRDGSCRIDPDKLRAAQSRFGTRITRVIDSPSGGVSVTIFSKKDCPVCDEAWGVIQSSIDELGLRSDLSIHRFDLDTAEGLVEGSLRNALEVPTTILEWKGEEMIRWEKVSPIREELISKISALPDPAG